MVSQMCKWHQKVPGTSFTPPNWHPIAIKKKIITHKIVQSSKRHLISCVYSINKQLYCYLNSKVLSVQCVFIMCVCLYNWGEPERAPHLREVRHRCLYVYIYVPYVVLGHGTNLCRVQNGQDGRPLRSRCVRLKYSLRTASNEKEVVRNEAYAPTSQPGKNTGIVRRNSAN